MAGRWSCEHCVLEFKELQASALAVDCIGKWALLAGRKNLAFVDLDQSKQTVMKVTRQSKWDIGCVQWNQHASHAHRFVTACNQRLDVFDFREGSALHLCSLKAHSRNVSDIDWSPFDVNIIASCSVDTFTYLWDVRDAKKPVKIFQTVSGAYQVKWNKVTNNLFATTHDGDIRIWDPRKGNSPVHYISAHPSKIHGLDWSHSDQHKLVTASQDCTIRFWDYRSPRRSEAMINSGNPVWRARYTPFGVGVMSVVLPQLRRGENSVYLWSKESESPIHTFVGHKDIILEFQWRKQMEGSLDHHLVTWSRDQSLRIWKVDPTLQKLCGHDVDDSYLMEDGAVTLPHIFNSYQEPVDKTEAFQEVKSIPKTSDPSGSKAPADSHSGLSASAPQSTSAMNGALDLGASKRSSSGNKLGELEESGPAPERKYTVEKVKVSSQVMYPTDSYQDSLVPFPRTCGARFCANDYLVMFNVPSSMKKMFEDSKTTPSALSDLVKFTTQSPQWMRPANNGLFPSNLFYGSSPQHPGEGVTISAWFTEKHSKPRHHRHSHRSHQGRSRDAAEGKRDRDREAEKQSRRLQKVGAIKIYNISSINPVDRFLAENYKIDRDNVVACCEHNAKVANEIGRKDLVQLWTLICHMSHPKLQPSPSVDHGRPWAGHPFGRNLVEKFLSHYSKHNDVQTMAMICCMFWDRESHTVTSTPPLTTYSPAADSMPSFEYTVTTPYNPYHTVSSMTNLLKGWTSSRTSHSVGQPDEHLDASVTETVKGLAALFRTPGVDSSIATTTSRPQHAPLTGPSSRAPLGVIASMRPPLPPPASLSSSSSSSSTTSSSSANESTSRDELTHLLRLSSNQPPQMQLHYPPPPPPSPLPLPSSATVPRLPKSGRVQGQALLAGVASQPNLAHLFRSVMKGKRSMSWSESVDVIEKYPSDSVGERDPQRRGMEAEKVLHQNNCLMLNPAMRHQHEHFKQSYANILYKWRLLNQRTQVLKHTISHQMEAESAEERQNRKFLITCCHCSKKTAAGYKCDECKRPILNCSVCHVLVRGTANVCLACCHGGHSAHMLDWFSTFEVCPTGCGCHCLET